MKYLFFDIECSNTFNGEGKICEFGYVITDESFNILEKRNLVMSPGPRGNHEWSFDNSRARCDKGFERWFDPIEYHSCQEFPHYYQTIYNLLTDSDTQVFGFAVENDISYIDYTCYRYNKDKPKYLAIDLKRITDAYSKIYPDPRFKAGLDDCFKKFYSVNEFIKIQAHKAVNDAYMTMMVMKKMCELYKRNPNELVNLYPSCKLDSHEKRTDWALNKANRDKLELERQQCKQEWKDYCKQFEVDINNPNTIYVTSELRSKSKSLKDALTFIKENNFIPVERVFKSKNLLVMNEHNKEVFLKSLPTPYSGKIIMFSEISKNIK